MDSIMNVLMTIFSPTIFWPVIGVISIGFIVVVIFSIFQDSKTKKQDVGIQKRLSQLQEQLSAKEDEVARAKEQSKAKEADYNHQLTRLEEQITENEANRARIKNLELQLKEKDEAVGKGGPRSEELEDKLKNIQSEIDKVKKEASLKTDMYNGLKNQYDELEGQLTSQAKKADESSQIIKKLEQELKEAKLKLLEALKHHRPTVQDEKFPSVIVADTQTTQDPASRPDEETKVADDKKSGLSVSSVYPPEAKPEILKQDTSDKVKPKEVTPASDKKEQDAAKVDIAKKQKSGIRHEAKVRLAQVMQEAAKVAIKKEEKPPAETKEQNKQEGSAPVKEDKQETGKPPTPEEPKSNNP